MAVAYSFRMVLPFLMAHHCVPTARSIISERSLPRKRYQLARSSRPITASPNSAARAPSADAQTSMPVSA
jgi:hypothetical protein